MAIDFFRSGVVVFVTHIVWISWLRWKFIGKGSSFAVLNSMTHLCRSSGAQNLSITVL